MRGVVATVLVWLGCAAHDASRAFGVSLAFSALFRRFCPRVFGVLVLLCLTHRLKGRAAFSGFVVYYLSSLGASLSVVERHAP